MTICFFFAVMFVVCLGAGSVGALTGLGGGVILVPVLVLFFGCDIHLAAGASLVSVIATSSGAGASFIKDGYTNLRVAMFLELATVGGALIGAYLSGCLNSNIIAFIFGLILIHSGLLAFSKNDENFKAPSRDALSDKLKLQGSFREGDTSVDYYATRVVSGFLVMLAAGILSGLLGIGSGALKVLAMDHIMALPLKVSTTTSNLMIGVTAAAGAGLYFKRGYVDLLLVAPVVLGVVAGSYLGARLLPGLKSVFLRKFFGFLLLIIAGQMIFRSLKGCM